MLYQALFASLAAISYTLLTGSGSARSGAEMTLTAITAAILGGTSMAGGSGSLIGSVLRCDHSRDDKKSDFAIKDGFMVPGIG